MSDPRRVSIVARANEADLAWLATLAPPGGAELEIFAVPVDDATWVPGLMTTSEVVVVPALGRASGVAVARALALARGPWLLLLESGDRLEPDALERLLGAASDAPAVLAGVEPAQALAALAGEPRALAGSLVRLEVLTAARWSGAGWRDAWELDLWLRLLPALGRAATTAPTLRVRACMTPDAATARERAVALARAFAETPPRAWPLLDRDGAPLDDASVSLELARLAAGAPEAVGVAAALWLRARALAAGGTLPTAATVDLIGELPGLARATPTVRERAPYAETGESAPLSVVLEVRSLDRGGLESVVVDLALGLGGEGVRAAVVCTERGGSEVERLRRAGVEVAVLGAADRAGELGAWLDGRDVDLLNAHYSDLGAPLAAARGIPVVVTLHNEYAWLPNGPDDALRRIDPAVDVYIAVSASAAAFCAARFAISGERIQVIRNALAGSGSAAPPPSPAGGRSAARAALGIPSDAELLLQIGRVDAVKSPLVLVDAVAALAAARPHLSAWIVGPLADREYAARLHARIEELALGERIVVAGHRHDVSRLLAAADVFVLPSLIEGLSLAVIEALAAGVPAVLSRTGDADFLLGEGEQTVAGPLPGALVTRPVIDPVRITPEFFHELAWRTDPGRGVALAAAIAEVLDDLPARCDAARRRAADLAPLFARERMVREYAALFRRAIAANAECAVNLLEESIADAERARENAQPATDALRDLVLGLLRADQALGSERREHEAARAALDDLASAVGQVSAALAPASARLEQALEKLRLGKRLRAAVRAAVGRASEEP